MKVVVDGSATTAAGRSCAPRRWRRRLSACLRCAGVILGLALGGAAGAERIRCADRNVAVITSPSGEAGAACHAAAEALRFLGANGLGTDGEVEIHLVSRLPKEELGDAMGCYDHRDRQIHVLDLAICRGKARVFDLPVDEELHRSLIAHEVAHAAAARNFTAAKPALAAQEYIAYVTQLAILSPDTRERILARYPGTGFETTAQINSTVFLMEPNFFAVQAYRHFLKPENGAAFIRRLLAGELSPDD